MTPEQKASVESLEELFDGHNVLHHGDCKGADEQFHELACKFGMWTVGHPPLNPKLRAYCDVDESREPKDYLVRDRDIVDETDELIATPAEMKEQFKGGTWYTVHYAARRDVKVTIVWPDGTINEGWQHAG